jgi:hypothetical protein
MARPRTNPRPIERADQAVAPVRTRRNRTVVAAAALVLLAVPISASAATPSDAAQSAGSTGGWEQHSRDHQPDWVHWGHPPEARDHGMLLRRNTAGLESQATSRAESGTSSTREATTSRSKAKREETHTPKATPTATPVAPTPKATPTATPVAPTLPSVTSVPSSFPDASTTGPRAGHSLQASGSLTITQDGAVISDLDINGCVNVQAMNVVISDVRIRCSSTYGINVKSGSVTVQHSELDGTGAVHVAVVGSNYTLSYVNIHDIEDGPRLGDNVTIEDSYIHDLFRTATSHNDAMQTTGATNITIRHNSIVPATNGDPMNAAIMIGSEFNPLRNMLIEGNYLNGGNYTILARSDLDGNNIVVRNNAFGHDYRYGAYRGATGMTLEANNIYADTRALI